MNRFRSRRTNRPYSNIYCIPTIEPLEERIALDDNSAGSNGIDSRNLTTPGGVALTGSGVRIGNVERGRPGKPGYDSPTDSHPAVVPGALYRGCGLPTPNEDTQTGGGHATNVAGVMIANGTANHGVARNAILNSSARVSSTGLQILQQYLVSMQCVAMSNVYATNMPIWVSGRPNSYSLLTQGLDWLTKHYNVLHVLARGHTSDGGILPKDNYNGMNVAFSKTVLTGGEPVFRQISALNSTVPDIYGRRLTHIVAPGNSILTTPIGGGAYIARTGNSFAAPHVTGTIALLHQYAGDRISAGAANWNGFAHQHEVIKALLMNSVDKLKDTGDGSLLGMTKDILKSDGTSTWSSSDARDHADNPGGPVSTAGRRDGDWPTQCRPCLNTVQFRKY